MDYSTGDLIAFGFNGFFLSFVSPAIIIWISAILGFYFLLKEEIIRTNYVILGILFIFTVFLSSAAIKLGIVYDYKDDYKDIVKCVENNKKCNKRLLLHEIKYSELENIKTVSGLIIASSKTMLIIMTKDNILKIPKKNLISGKIPIDNFKKKLE